MALYFFHLRDGDYIPDETGAELPTLEAARIHAAAFIGAVLRDNPAQFWRDGDWTEEVADKSGLTLFTLSLMATDAPILFEARASGAGTKLQ